MGRLGQRRRVAPAERGLHHGHSLWCVIQKMRDERGEQLAGVIELLQLRQHRQVDRSCFVLSLLGRGRQPFAGRTGTVRLPPRQDGGQVFAPNRFRYIVVHARRQTLLAIALHRIGRHGDDWHVTRANRLFSLILPVTRHERRFTFPYR